MQTSRVSLLLLSLIMCFVAYTAEIKFKYEQIRKELVQAEIHLRIRKSLNESSQLSPESTSETIYEVLDRTSESSSERTYEFSAESRPTYEPSRKSRTTFQLNPEGTSETSPEVTSEPSPEGTSEASPEGTSEPSPESTSEASPEGTSEASPKGTPEPSPEGTSEASPESTSEASPEGTPEPSPEGTSEASPEGTSEASPEGTSEASPEGTPEPSPEGTSEASPEGTSEASPEGTSEPSPEGTPEPSPEGTSEPSPQGTSEASPEGISEASLEGTPEPSPERTSQPRREDTPKSSPEGGSEATPENFPKKNPENESGASEPTPKDGTHTISEPNAGQSEPEPTAETWPEPAPEWEKAFKQWQGAWPAHTYIFAIIFLLMAFYSAYYIVFNVKDGLNKKYLSISLNIMMCILSLTRSFILFIDPYHQGVLINDKLVFQLMWSIGSPCLLASDSLCILALAESASVNVMHQRFQKISNIIIVIFLHFVLVIATDVIVSAHSTAKVMILYCQLFTITWGLLLGVWYFNLAYKINQVLFVGAGRRKSRGDRVYLLLIYLSSAANVFTCGLVLYAAVGVFGIYSEVEFVDAWSWYSLQTGFRVSEVIAAVLVFTVSAKRNRIKSKVHNAIVIGQPQLVKETPHSECTTPTIENLYPPPRNRRMSMFSAVHQSKVFANDSQLFDNDKAQLNRPPPNISVSNSNQRSQGRRMSLFSQLHETKLSATLSPHENHLRSSYSGFYLTQDSRRQADTKLSIPEAKEDDNSKPIFLLNQSDESYNRNTTSSQGMFSQLQGFSQPENNFKQREIDAEEIQRDRSLKAEERSKHSNSFSKFFHTKVVPVGSSVPKLEDSTC